MPLPEQRVIGGRYRLMDVIGRGGTAEVWRAHDEALARTVAVKLVTVPTDEGAQRAGEEARLLAGLSHPSLVPVYDAGTDENDRPWVVMELVEGETLGDTVRRGPLDPVRAAVVGQAVAEALAYVHAQGLVHRDVKPGNVLMGRDGRVRLTDFGIARLVDAAKVTATGMTVGTASYLAPEQVMGERVTPMADVYALGLVLLECLTGRREYAGSTVEVALARLNRQPDVPVDLPAGWPQLLTAMTAREPDARPTAGEVAEELSRIASGGTATTVLASPTTAQPVVDRTQVLQQTRVAPAAVPPAVARPVARPVAPEALPVADSDDGWKWALALVAVIAVLIGGAALAGLFDKGSGRTPAAVSNSVPGPVATTLRNLQREVAKAGEER
ncbi:MAG: putative serine/threonine-protein kinase [Frankiales bacterium]|nr:putative serine/threonine-protein kinase [Frankiales bacterium]